MRGKPKVDSGAMVKTGQNIKRLRVERKMTQGVLAYRMGVTIVSVHNWEHATNNITLEHAVKLAKILGVTVEELTS